MPDGKTDATAAFQSAMNSLAGSGGTVIVPAGNWSFASSLVLPRAVNLVGSYLSVPSHATTQGDSGPNSGTVIFVRGGRGNATGPAFLTVSEDCTCRGMIFFYPDNIRGAAPAAYPYTINMVGNNPAVVDVELLNVWNGIRAVQSQRHYIARVQGQPANVGIFVDETYDIGRIEVSNQIWFHLWPH